MRDAVALTRRVLALVREIGEVDGEVALACFRSSPGVLRTVAIEQFEEWAHQGLVATKNDARARRSYFALETRSSYNVLHTGGNGLALDSVKDVLRLYVEALTGRQIEIAPIAAVPIETRIGDGKTIHLPSLVAEFGEDDLDFVSTRFSPRTAPGRLSSELRNATHLNCSPRSRKCPKRTIRKTPKRVMPLRSMVTLPIFRPPLRLEKFTSLRRVSTTLLCCVCFLTRRSPAESLAHSRMAGLIPSCVTISRADSRSGLDSPTLAGQSTKSHGTAGDAFAV